jgi:tetratricopeptide (TPR) repeat protein
MRFRPLAAAAAMLFLLAVPAGAHEVDEGTGQLGKVNFANSCDAKVQKELQRAVAMLHSFWFSAGEKAFRHVLEHDPSCAVATFGIAALLMSNPLAGQGASPKGAEAAMAAIEQGRRIGAKTQRERDYIEAVAAYFADFANRPERARQAARAQAFDALAAKYPEDDEAQIFAALFAGALPRFLGALKRFPEAANVHNELGYTFRRLGRLDKAFEHYKRALAIDPRHRGAHEYIGEAYLMVGDVASAEKHLAALRSICTLPCEEMRELQAALDAHRRRP